MSLPSIGVIITKLKLLVTRATYAQKIAALKTVLTNDFTRATEEAHAALDTGMSEVKAYATAELKTVEAMVQSAAARASVLISQEVLAAETVIRAKAVEVAGVAHLTALTPKAAD